MRNYISPVPAISNCPKPVVGGLLKTKYEIILNFIQINKSVKVEVNNLENITYKNDSITNRKP